MLSSIMQQLLQTTDYQKVNLLKAKTIGMIRRIKVEGVTIME